MKQDDRLLTPKELEKAIGEAVGYLVSVKTLPDDDRAIMEAQDTKTEELVLKDVGNWLQDLYATTDYFPITIEDINNLLQGKKPEGMK